MRIDELQREAVLAAEFVLASDNTPLGDPVPVFNLIEDRGVWLKFEANLDRLLGAYQRIDDQTAGIFVNVARPLSLQRFTAAHELGHHELGHTSHIDDESTVLNPSKDPQEIQAQTFAASLLMSEVAIETRLEHRGHDPERPSLNDLDIYLLSSELGVSYTAAITQLNALHKISFPAAERLRRVRPLALKERILGGRKPDNPRANVWQLTLADNHRRVQLNVGDELDIALPEVRSSGYEWITPANLLEAFSIVNDRYVPPRASGDDVVFGGSGTRHITIKAHAPHRARLDFDLNQPWDGGEQGGQFTLDAVVSTVPLSEVGQGISINQQAQLLAA